MNYCTKCASLYQTPGTCNCYAQAQPVVPFTLPIYPTYPLPTYPAPYQPYRTGDFPPFGYPTWCYS